MKYIYAVFILVFAVFSGSKLVAQENIAPLASALKTSYVSSWEKLNAINDGYDPQNSTDKGAGAYGNWNTVANYNQWNWVEYNFAEVYSISSSQVYWWTDGGGIQIPYETYIQYQDIFSGEWKTPEDVQGNGILTNQYNTTTFSAVLTTKIRIYCISTAAQGILEWKIIGNKANHIPTKTTVLQDHAFAKGTTSQITVTANDANGNVVQDYEFELDVHSFNFIQTENETYQVNGQTISNQALSLKLTPTNNNGATTFGVILPAKVDPNDGIEITLKLKDGIASVQKFSFFEPGLIAPTLVADAIDNNVDHSIEITFIDQPEWRSRISGIEVDGKILSIADYNVEAGKLTLNPAAGNKLLTKSGSKVIVVKALGYTNASVIQLINAGAVSAINSYIDRTVKIYRPSITKIAVYAFDAYKNPVEEFLFKYDVEIVNTTATTQETYSIEGVEIHSNITNQLMKATNSEGKTWVSVQIPAMVDTNDGILFQLKLNDNTLVGEKSGYIHNETEKIAYLPNDLKKNKEFSWDKTLQTENFTAFWGTKTGTDPLHPLEGNSFDPKVILDNLEEYYSFYVDSMRFILNPDSLNMGKYKFVVILFDTWKSDYQSTGAAYGGSIDDVIGAMWMSPMTGFIIAHEFGHACQAMIPIQYPGKGFKNNNDDHVVGMYWEACANYMAYLSSGSTGNMISPLFMNTSMLPYLSTIDMRQYESVYLPAYITDKYGIEALGKQWRGADKGDNPFDAMMKGLGMTRNEMRREAGLWAMHNVTWDYSIGDIIRGVMNSQDASAVCRKYTYLEAIKGVEGKYIVPREMAPADYGYNIIPVYPNKGATTIIAKLSGFNNDLAGGGGWSYGFMAVSANGKPRYGEVSLETDESTKLIIESTDSLFYFVVTGSPVKTNTYTWTPNWPRVYRFPYAVEFENVLPAGQPNENNSSKSMVSGAPHLNGGGWVASTAKVDASAYVGQNAQVLESAKVLGNARVEDFAVVQGTAQVKDNAIVRGNAIVGKAAVVSDYALVEKAARVYNGKISESGVVTGNAAAFNCKVSGKAVLKDVAWLTNVTVSGTTVVGGDKNSFATCSEGIYLGLNQDKCDGRIWDSKITEDVNPVVEAYYYPYGDIPQSPDNIQVKALSGTSVLLTWDDAPDNGSIVNYILFQNDKAVGFVAGTSDTITGLNPKTSYSFSLRARDNAGNISEVSDKVQVNTLTSAIDITKKDFDFTINPNPTDTKFNIQLSQNETVNLTIFNMLGKVAYSNQFCGTISIDKSDLGESGLYLVKVEHNNNDVVKKLVIN